MLIDGLNLTNSSTISAVATQLPQISITDTFLAATQAEMLALIAQTGDVCIRTDLQKSFILKGSDPAVLADWQELLNLTITPYDIVVPVFGKPAASEVVLRMRAARAFTLSNVQTNGQARATTGATSSPVFVIAKNGTQVGTISFGAGAAQTVGIISIGSTVSFAVGDLLTLTAPATPDATLADIDFSLVATV